MLLALEAVEALCSGPSFLTADPMGPLLDQDEEEVLSPSSPLEGEVPASPLLSLSPYHILLSPPSPPPGHPSPSSSPSQSSFLEAKAGSDVTPLPWLAAGELLHAHVGADDIQDDAFAGMDWMSEKIDLGDFDLESLIGSCSSDEPPAFPEDLLASLRCHMDLDLEPFRVAPPADGHPKPAAVPAEVVMKSEPCSPAPPPSPGFSESETDTKSPLADIPPNPELPLEEAFVKVLSPPSSDGDSDSGIESSAGSPRAKPYAKPELPSASSSPSAKAKVKSSSGAPKVVEKKLKKMEQNKTAATRYRQKKRVEQEQLSVECEALETRNRELAERADAISREIHYLKDLMEEVRKHHRGKMRAGAK
ncbi:cyclic AMP-dependent transcription factor ATF-4 isoform X2 [Phycodurus eques]|uniref:cyclic AMP-dependent transcription factor ATF-4 isoform X2 n=1 Tax=Phycodurus eques TaxID=693459 RepID=UPI002ACE8C21|nr:cyclic AMP-dependent transcription factor ATF-4 isoform X2 [Phycodurus eques]